MAAPKPKQTRRRKRYEQHCERLVEWLRGYLLLGEYRYTVHFGETSEDFPDAYAWIVINTTYLEFSLHITDQCWEDYKLGLSGKIFNALAHELSHILTEPLYLIAVDAVTNQTVKTLDSTRERQTQRIANVIVMLTPRSLCTRSADFPSDHPPPTHTTQKTPSGITAFRGLLLGYAGCVIL